MNKIVFWLLSVLGLFCCLLLFHNMYILALYNIVFISIYNIFYKPKMGNLTLFSVFLVLITILLLAVEIITNVSGWDIIISELGNVFVFAVLNALVIFLALFTEKIMLEKL